MTAIDINNYSFKYTEDGSGEPVVLVHGSASDYRTWQAQRDEFAGQFRVIDYSRRYHWPNERIPEGADYAMAKHVDDLEALIRRCDAAPAHLVGHSYGAFLCLLLAAREPELVRTLVLTEPPVVTLFVSNSPKPLEILKLLLSRPRTALAIIKFGARGLVPAGEAMRRGDTETALRLFGGATLGPETFDRLSESRLEQARANLIKAELLGSGLAPLDPDQVRGVRTPALLINGERSPDLFHLLTDRLQELLPHSERIEIGGASHIAHEDNPPAYNAAVLAFLAGQGTAT
jgi:pimeloyl-ACP methyl ester carboxylesterase